MKKLATLIVLFITSFSVVAQFTDEQIEEFINNASQEELLERNTLISMEGNFHQAGMIAEALLEIDSMNANYNYRMGIALINSSSDFTKSVKFLERASKNTSKNYDVFSVKETAAPIDVLFHLGRSYHLRKEIDKAVQTYSLFLEKAPKKSNNIALAELKIQQCAVAKELMENPIDFKVVNLGQTVNSSSPDYSPVVSLDGSAIYYTSRRLRKDSSNMDIKEPQTDMYLEDVYVTYKGFDDDWQEPFIMEFCKPELNEATVAVSADERRIYIYKDEVGDGDIFYSDFEASEFKELKRLETKSVNTEFWEPHITVSPDGKHKYFVSDRPGGYGGRDIYRIEKMPNGEWSEPMNLGPTINTQYDEDAPFLAVDNKTLYFSSNGPKSMGGFDVFRSKMNDLGQWAEPLNLGVPLNTTGDDIYYTTTMDGFTGYLSSFREGGQGEKDIYEIKNTHLGIDNVAGLKGDIETVDGSPIPSDISYTLNCLTCEEDYKVTLFPRVKDGRFYASLFPCETYEMRFYSDKGKNEFYTETFSTNCVDEYQEIYKHILLDVENMKVIEPEPEVSVFEPLSFKHYFDYNKNALDPEEGALKEFLEEVNKQSDDGRDDFTFNIESSASKVTTRTFKDNQVLAQTRADEFQALMQAYFSDKDIEGVDIKIDNVAVNGPDYSSGDYKNIAKYAPYQYVEVSLKGLNQESDENGLSSLKSKDKELSEKTDLPGVPVNSKMVVSGIRISSSENANESLDSSNDDFASQKPNAEFNSEEEMTSNDQYHVIVGVFKRKDYADKLVSELNGSGYSNARIIGKRKGMYAVAADSFTNEGEAKSLLTQVRTDINSMAWMLKPFMP